MANSSFFSSSGPTSTENDAIKGSVINAAASAAAAALSEAAAAASSSTATNAANSVASVAADAATATTKANAAAASAAASEVSRQASGVSATASETAKNTSVANASTATTKASEASTSATNSAASAATSSTKAADSETARAASVVAKDASVVAKDASIVAKDAAVVAKTGAETALASIGTSATNAASSATASANSAASSAAQVTLAAAQVTLATAQKDLATTKAGEASASASSASTAQAAAVAAKDAALAAFDSFDDRYLGQKSSDPSADNDGDSLAAGMLYFNTTSDVMKVYEGSAWVAAYASLSGTMTAANNLSDVASVASARNNLGLGSAALSAASAFATASQADQTVGLTGAGATTVSGTYPNFTITSTDTNTNTTYSVQDGELSQNNFTDADHTKLNGIASGANNYVLPFTDNSSNWNSSYTYSQVGHLPLAGGTMTGALVLNNTGSVKVSAGTTGQREGSPAAGMFRYNTTEGKFEGYSTEWGEIGGGAADLKLNSFTGNGSTTAYTLSSSPVEDNTLVYIDGVYQNKTSYAIVNNVLTFSEAPATSAAIEITAATIAPVTASTEFKLSQFTGNGSTTAFTLSAQSPENNTNVYISGVYQSKSNYSVSGTTLTFSTAPPNGAAIEVMAAHAVVVSVSTPDDNTVTTAKIVNNAVTTAKIADGSITSAKLGAGVGGAFNDFAVKTGAYTAVTRDQLIVNSSSAVTITLPASPSAGNVVFIKNAGAGVVTVGRNGSKINSTTDDGSLAADAGATLVYVDATIGWKEL